MLYCAATDGDTHHVRRSPTSRVAHFADVTSSSPTADNDADFVSAVNELTSNSRCGDCDWNSDTGSHTPTSITSSNSGGDSGALYRQPLQHTLLSRQQRKKRSRAAFSHAQVNTSCTQLSLFQKCAYYIELEKVAIIAMHCHLGPPDAIAFSTSHLLGLRI